MEEDTKKIYLKLFNTESRQKERISAKAGQTLKMYTCGPTVYDYAHIGNFRTYVFEDLLRKTLKYFGFSLKQVMNFTDVDDKTINGAMEKKMPLSEYTKIYKEAFLQDIKTLNIEPVEVYVSATDYIKEMIEMIEKLLKKGVAYVGTDGCIYYRLSTFPSYGRLSHIKLDSLKPGASECVSEDEYEKESVADFVLWKSYRKERDGDVFWESPFGLGRPGWHIECSAMAMKCLGETLDIHVGGVDNIFPHHDNEIAQSEACTEKIFVHHWIHAEHLLVDGKKMSKSLGNFYTLRDLLEKGYTGRQVRYMLLQTHYRKQLNFTFQGLEAAKHSLARLDDFMERLREIEEQKEGNVVHALTQKTEKAFKETLADDLGISEALAAVFNLVREGNALCDHGKIGKKEAEEILQALSDFDRVLGILFFEEEIIIPEDVQKAFESRLEARGKKDFQEADKWRDYIEEKGFTIEDSPKGSRLKLK